MKLGEKLQKLRKRSGLSQEQLAARLSVSRQAVSKWELDETMPDTENVVQLSRLFGVSCDYLLRDEADAPGAVPPPQGALQSAAPGERHLDERGWEYNALVLSLGVCAAGVLMVVGTLFFHRSTGLLLTGLAIQVLGLVMFELAAPRMGEGRSAARLKFYMIACWMLAPAPAMALHQCLAYGLRWRYSPSELGTYLLLGGLTYGALFLVRRRTVQKK